MPRRDCEAHLGILRTASNNNVEAVDAQIMAARQCTFMLKNAGYYGLKGTGPEPSTIKYKSMVLSILLYGAEALVLSDKELGALSSYHRQTLRCLQHFPKSTAVPALHLLSGIAPVEALLDIRMLTFFRSALVVNTNNPPLTFIRQLVIHQLATKDLQSASWTAKIKKLLAKYQLPTPADIVADPPSKDEWKLTVKRAVHHWWSKSLKEEAREMSTLKFLNLDACRTDKMHPIWKDVTNALDIQKATVQALLLVRRYPLTTSHTAGTRKCEKCPLCETDPETTVHFLLHCPALQHHKYKFLIPILDACRSESIPVTPEDVVRVILDPTALPNQTRALKRSCRDYVYKLHNARSVLLGGESVYKRR